MRKRIEIFACGEAGAITVDWVVLAAAIVGLAVAVMASVQTELGDISPDPDTVLAAALKVGGSGSEAAH